MVDLKSELFWWCPWGSGVRLSVLFPSDYCSDKYVGPGWPGASDGLGVPPPGNCLRCHCLSSLSALCWEYCLKLMAAARLTGLKGLYFRPTTATTQCGKHTSQPSNSKGAVLLSAACQKKAIIHNLNAHIDLSLCENTAPVFTFVTTLPKPSKFRVVIWSFFSERKQYVLEFHIWVLKAWEVQVFVKTIAWTPTPCSLQFYWTMRWKGTFLFKRGSDQPTVGPRGNIELWAPFEPPIMY